MQEENEVREEKKESKFRRFIKNNVPQKGDSGAELARKIVLIVCILVVFAGIIYFINLGIQEWKNKSLNEGLGNEIVDVNNDKAAWEKIKAKYPNVDFPEGMNPKFADLYVRNPDMVGWLTIENTNINFPVVKGETDEEYLHKSFDGKETKYGNPFMASRNNAKNLDLNTVIHGHHMRTGSQAFSDLKKYRSVDGFKEHPVIKFSTLYNDYSWKVYAVFLTNSFKEDDNGYVFNYLFGNLNREQSYKGYIAELDKRKLYITGVDIKSTDRILTLSTCEYDWDGARLVVVARMVRPGESEEVNVSKAKKNPNPKFPQIYYDKHDLKNPFKNDEQWVAY